MGQKIVAVALEVVADEVAVIAVCDEAHALGEEGIVELDLFQPDRALLARDLGEPRDLVDELALAHAAQRECEFHPQRQPVEDT